MKKVIFWLDKYPRSITGTLQYLADHSEYEVICICSSNQIDPMRLRMGWDRDPLPGVEIKFANQNGAVDSEINRLIESADNIVHVFGGFRVSKIKNIFIERIFPLSGKTLIFSERPYAYDSGFLRTLMRDALHKYYAVRYQKYISAYLVMGSQGVSEMERIGWDQKKLFPFLYHKKFSPTRRERLDTSSPLRMIYVGQFDRRKGVDILMQAIDEMDRYEFHLELVGGEGQWH